MGFGLLLIGYAILQMFFVLQQYAFVGMLIGYVLMFWGLSELRKYCPTFLYTIITCVLMIFCSFFESFAGIDTLLGLGMLTNMQWLKDMFLVIEFVIELIFNLALLYGIADLARRVDFQDIRIKAFRNMIFIGIYNLGQLFLLLPVAFIQNDRSFFNSLLMIPWIVCTVLNFALIFKCYAFICPQGDEEMERKPSRFEFINKINARNDAKEQETLDYYNKKFEDMKNNRANKKKHKKK